MRKYLIGLVGILFFNEVFANSYWVESDMRLHASIALNQLNRIQVFEDRISQVFGNEESFTVETDTENGQIFIKAKDQKPIFLTLVTENGASIDLALNPIETEAQTLVLKTTPLPQQQRLPTKTEPLTKRILDLMAAMNADTTIDGFIRLKASKEEQLEFLSLELQSIYEGEGINGELWLVKNRGHKTQYLTEKQFATEPGILALALKTDVLKPNASTTLLKVLNHD